MKTFIVACCNPYCRDEEFDRFAKIVCGVPGVRINRWRHAVTDSNLVVFFDVASDSAARKLEGMDVIGLHTCGGHLRKSCYLDTARIGMKAARKPWDSASCVCFYSLPLAETTTVKGQRSTHESVHFNFHCFACWFGAACTLHCSASKDVRGRKPV